jgi:drug/metabolite transporter (DMT)-like permease
VANLVVTLEPIFTAILAYALLGERLSGIQIGGGLLILLGIVIIRLHEGRQVGALSAEEPVAGD